ncbi:MAG: nitrile hydratase accessory protein [Shimia sp.]
MPGSPTSPPPEAPFEAPFEAPWHAQLFALTVALSEAGAFGWPAWTDRFARAVATGAPYWEAWQTALCDWMSEAGIADAAQVAALTAAWHTQAEATPHGAPIEAPPLP